MTTDNNTQNITFPGQYPDEKVLLLKRHHPVTQLGFILYVLTMLALPLCLYLISIYIWQITFTKLLLDIFLFIASLYLLFLLLITFYIIIDYYLDIWIITDQRIISVEQKGIFKRVITEVQYERIEDITSDVSGLLGTYFGFGTIYIQTAGESERMILRQVSEPIETRRIISEAYKKATESQASLPPS